MLMLFLGAFLLVTEVNAKTPGRQKVIDFEGSLVEGVNKRPWDSVSQLSQTGNVNQKPHLYRKRRGFRAETLSTLRELGHLP